MLGRGRVEVAGRLVGQQQVAAWSPARGRSRCAAARRPTAAPADDRAAGRAPSCRAVPRRAHSAAALRGALDQLRHHDVLERRKFRQQLVELIDEAHLGAAHARALVVRHARAIATIDDDAAGCRASRAVPPHAAASTCPRPTARPAPRPGPEYSIALAPVEHADLPLALLERAHEAFQASGPVWSAAMLASRHDDFPSDPTPQRHSYRSASTGSSRDARHDGYSVASTDSSSAISTIMPVSNGSMSAGMLASDSRSLDRTPACP